MRNCFVLAVFTACVVLGSISAHVALSNDQKAPSVIAEIHSTVKDPTTSRHSVDQKSDDKECVAWSSEANVEILRPNTPGECIIWSTLTKGSRIAY